MLSFILYHHSCNYFTVLAFNRWEYFFFFCCFFCATWPMTMYSKEKWISLAMFSVLCRLLLLLYFFFVLYVSVFQCSHLSFSMPPLLFSTFLNYDDSASACVLCIIFSMRYELWFKYDIKWVMRKSPLPPHGLYSVYTVHCTVSHYTIPMAIIIINTGKAACSTTHFRPSSAIPVNICKAKEAKISATSINSWEWSRWQ